LQTTVPPGKSRAAPAFQPVQFIITNGRLRYKPQPEFYIVLTLALINRQVTEPTNGPALKLFQNLMLPVTKHF
jgi:hypothetical protein